MIRILARKRVAGLVGGIALLLVLAVPTLAATGNQIWRSSFKSTTVHGGSTITVLANGMSATAAVKAYAASGSTVSARICAGACSSSNVIVSFTRFRVPASGVTREWHRLSATQFADLKKAIADKTAPTLEVTVSKGTAPATTTTSTFALVK